MFSKGKYGRYLPRLMSAVDFVLLNGAMFAVEQLNASVPELRSKLVWLLLNVAYLPAAKYLNGVHNDRFVQMDAVVRSALLAALSHLLVFVTLLYLMDVDSIGLWVFAEFYGLFTTVLVAWRIAARSLLKHYRRRGGNMRRVVIIGCGSTAERLYGCLTADDGFGVDVQGFFDIYCPPGFPHKDLYLGNLSDLEAFVKANRTEEIFYAISAENTEALQLSIGLCDALMMKFYYVPRISPYMPRAFTPGAVGQVPVMTIHNNPLEQPFNAALKRGFDILFSSAFLLVSPVIFIPIAIAIKLSSPGPVFFKQLRTGYKGREFYCYKFRTMKVNASADTVQATRDDPRKTRLGDFLRRTSLDELPQFINVLKGDMSVVGPRPHMLKHTEDYRRLIKAYMVRHLIRPGITGWAQVMGFRGQTEELWQMEGRVEHDIWYMEHWSFLLDIKIIFRTILNALKNDEQAF